MSAEYLLRLNGRRLRFTVVQPLRDLRIWVRDVCATFRENDVPP
jgi:hypothetical protein